MKIITTGRTDIKNYFKLSGIREYQTLNHTPFIVFIEKKEVIEVIIVDNILDLLAYPDKTKVMAQWRGNWTSDFFQFIVGDLRKFIKENPKEEYHLA